MTHMLVFVRGSCVLIVNIWSITYQNIGKHFKEFVLLDLFVSIQMQHSFRKQHFKIFSFSQTRTLNLALFKLVVFIITILSVY